jgi:hypothetical protein
MLKRLFNPVLVREECLLAKDEGSENLVGKFCEFEEPRQGS